MGIITSYQYRSARLSEKRAVRVSERFRTAERAIEATPKHSC
jgi:hypothetical protein